MKSENPSIDGPPAKRQRATQQRAEDTKEAIIAAGVQLFSTQGFDGVSIRAIEQSSNTRRGLVNYHFESKEALWKVVVDRIVAKLPDINSESNVGLQSLDKEAQIRALMTAFIHYSAQHPELSRLIIQEGKAKSWRLTYLVENYVRPRIDWIANLFEEFDAHTLYIFIGAATLVFDVEAECETLFGFNPRNEAFVQEHAKRVCDLVIGMRRTTQS